jgi:hypothetical protein
MELTTCNQKVHRDDLNHRVPFRGGEKRGLRTLEFEYWLGRATALVLLPLEKMA